MVRDDRAGPALAAPAHRAGQRQWRALCEQRVRVPQLDANELREIGAGAQLGELRQLEPGFDDDAVEALRRSWRINAWSERNLYFGGVHAVDPAAGGAGDPRRCGHGSVVN